MTSTSEMDEREPARVTPGAGMAGGLPVTISVEEAGRILGVKRRAAYRAAARGQIPTIRLGRRLFVPTAELLQLVGVTVDVDTATLVTVETP